MPSLALHILRCIELSYIGKAHAWQYIECIDVDLLLHDAS